MIWFDLDNSPHVPLFIPVFNELKERNIPFEVTARDFAQTLELLGMRNIPHTAIGAHGGKSKINKIINLFERSSQLKKYAVGKNFKIALSHGSRTQLLAANKLHLKSILMMDYEFTERKIFNRYSTWLLIPKFIPDERLKSAGLNLDKVIRYNGFKEELYLNSFVPGENFRNSISIDKNSILILIRPPGMLGNYHDEKSEGLLIHAINYFTSFNNAVVLISGRSQKDKDFINSNIGEKSNLRFLEKAVDGLELVYSADIVLSGGGTMNRESALLGAKTYSIFTARKPYLDEYLESLGRLTFIESKEQIDKIEVVKQSVKIPYEFNKNIVKEVTGIIIDKMNG
ncbi:MAG: DUF354 domain-containing protein [Chlorobi bacterium]|nr:DUF354 domain-containing protein [Chlorobiota bacterium]